MVALYRVEFPHTHAYTPYTVIFSCSLQVRKFWQKGCVPFTVPCYNGFVSNCARDPQLPVFSCLFSLRLTFCGILLDTAFFFCVRVTHTHRKRKKQRAEGANEGGREAERCFADRITLSPPCQISDIMLNISRPATLALCSCQQI